ncbi:MAG: hypothetical protein JST00_25990 [Deltaproteobacteria bacterium]|nr:hypothetical protein [Deltaproteobacteria bacterium]
MLRSAFGLCLCATAILGGCRAILGIEEGFLESPGGDGGDGDGSGNADATGPDGGDGATPDAGDADASTCTEELYSGEAIADTFLSQLQAGTFGGQDTMLVGQDGTSVGLVTFSLAEGDAGALEGGVARLRTESGLSAELRLEREAFGASQPGAIDVHLLRADWAEGTTDAGADWMNRAPSAPWSAAGASGSDERAAVVGNASVVIDGGPMSVRIPLPTLTSVVAKAPAAWTPGEAVSFALVPKDGLYVSIYTRESETKKPRLVIRGPCRDR